MRPNWPKNTHWPSNLSVLNTKHRYLRWNKNRGWKGNFDKSRPSGTEGKTYFWVRKSSVETSEDPLFLGMLGKSSVSVRLVSLSGSGKEVDPGQRPLSDTRSFPPSPVDDEKKSDSGREGVWGRVDLRQTILENGPRSCLSCTILPLLFTVLFFHEWLDQVRDPISLCVSMSED